MNASAFDVAGRFERDARAADFVRFATAMALGRGSLVEARTIFAKRWPKSRHVELVLNTKAEPGTTYDGSPAGWGSPLAAVQPLADAFVDVLRPATVIGRMTGFRRVPFNVRFPVQTASAGLGWVGEAENTPVSDLGFTANSFAYSKLGGIVVITNELAQLSDPAAEALIQRDFVASISEFQDSEFLDPDGAATDARPASITNGATEIASTGSTAAQVEADMLDLVAAVTTNLTSPYLIMRKSTALHLATLRTTSGDRVFPNVGVKGGDVWQIPVLTTENVPDDGGSPALNRIVLVDAAEILLAEGGIEIDTSTQASVELNGVLRSLFQENLVGLKVIRAIRWQRRRDGAVAYINVTY